MKKINEKKKTDWSLIISILALVISLLTVGFNYWHSERFREMEVIETAKIKVVENTANLKYYYVAGTVIRNDPHIIYNYDPINLFDFYAKNRNIYHSIQHRFSKESRAKLDQIIHEIEDPITRIKSTDNVYQKFVSFSDSLTKEIDKILN